MGRKLVIYYNKHARFGRPDPQTGFANDAGVLIYRAFSNYNFGILTRENPAEVWIKQSLKEDGSILCLARARVLAVNRERGQTTVVYLYDHCNERVVVRPNAKEECPLFFIKDETVLEPLIDESCGKATTVID